MRPCGLHPLTFHCTAPEPGMLLHAVLCQPLNEPLNSLPVQQAATNQPTNHTFAALSRCGDMMNVHGAAAWSSPLKLSCLHNFSSQAWPPWGSPVTWLAPVLAHGRWVCDAWPQAPCMHDAHMSPHDACHEIKPNMLMFNSMAGPA
jgi:hypothetical protein